MQKNQLTKKEEISLLTQTIIELDEKDKVLIYRSVQDDINKELKEGDRAYALGHRANALKHYKLVNFYENKNVVSLKKINSIKSTAKKRCKYHYNKALKYTKSDKKIELIALNIVMMNNPEYKDTKQKTINAKTELKPFLDSLNRTLNQELNATDSNTTDLKSYKDLRSAVQKLRVYEYDNKLVSQADNVLEKHYKSLLKDSITLYKQSKLKKAQKSFSALLYVYNNDITAQNYLKKIKIKKNKQLNIKLAQEALKSQNYKLTMVYIKKVLSVDKNNKTVRNLLLKLNNQSNLKIQALLKQGKKYYINKDLDKAKESFQKALDIDKSNNTALVFSKKIQRQLDTIKSLEK